MKRRIIFCTVVALQWGLLLYEPRIAGLYVAIFCVFFWAWIVQTLLPPFVRNLQSKLDRHRDWTQAEANDLQKRLGEKIAAGRMTEQDALQSIAQFGKELDRRMRPLEWQASLISFVMSGSRSELSLIPLKLFRWLLPRSRRVEVDLAISDLKKDRRQMRKQGMASAFIHFILLWHGCRIIGAHVCDGIMCLLRKMEPLANILLRLYKD